MNLERVLTKLKFDESVSGYALLTNDGSPFLSFALPEHSLPLIQGTMKIHASSLKMMNIMTGDGVVILARVNPEWVLAVNFSELQLGIALKRTQDVVELLKEVDLPAPPTPDEEPEEEMEPEPDVPEAEIEPAETSEPTEEIIEEIPLDEVEIRHGCLILRGPLYNDAASIDSELSRTLKEKYSGLGTDILLMVDEKRTTLKIAEILGKTVDNVIQVLCWCVSKRILDAECPEEQESGIREIVEVPLFEGSLEKAKKEHRQVLELCNGINTLHEIAARLGVQYFEALQSTLPYKGKTLRYVKRDKSTKG
ncbi:hypothetical protein EU538_00305 [Candidatus Thorarchaeota archaeon]|nr:MAG: hypothetical protein EU538_00305 [Candidatus Thorarchaeota archaeon]